MVSILYGKKYRKNLQELIIEIPTIGSNVDQRVKWFRNNPPDTRLRNHSLHKKLEGKWAFSVTGDIRIIYKWVGTNTVRLLTIGRHKMVYR